MKKYVEMAATLAGEIEAAESHLANLRNALNSMKPLIQPDSSQPRALTFGGRDVFDVVEVRSPREPIFGGGDGATGDAPAPARRGRKPRVQGSGATARRAKANKTVRKTRAARKAEGAKGDGAAKARRAKRPPDENVPVTGTDFWLKQIGRGKHSVREMVERAMKTLKLGDDSRKVLTNRAGAWLNRAQSMGLVAPDGQVDGVNAYRRA